MNFHDFLIRHIAQEETSTEDVLASFLPLVREVIETHRAGAAAPLEGVADLQVEGSRIWFEQAKRRPIRRNDAQLARLEAASRAAIEVMTETRRTTELDDGSAELLRAEIGQRGVPLVRPVYLPGYVAWEHELNHHDPLTDIFSLGLILASLACLLDLNDPADVEALVTHRRNLFALNPNLHPALAQAIWRMTELDRHRRAQDLPALLASLENYRDQSVTFEIDLARLKGLEHRDAQTRSQAVLGKLRDRLFDLSRRNSLLHFRPTAGSLNLTQASVPLLLDYRNIREDQILVWSDDLRQKLAEGKPISLNKHLNFAEALYLPSVLERIMADARRDQQEYGFAQLRLVVCFLSWANLKVKPAETFVSPLVLLPVKLVKSKGIRDTFSLEALTSEAEVNPVVRHQFRQLYDIELPETVDLAERGLDELLNYLTARVQSSEPAVTLERIDRPRIDLIHEKARRRVDQYRRRARLSGRGVRHFLNLDYSYDPANYHPLGIKLFSAMVRTPSTRLREIIEERPRPHSYAVADAAADIVETERTFVQLRSGGEENPYLWSFDLCNLTLANFRYRRMSLVRDYEAILRERLSNPAFEATFSLSPRPASRELPAAPPLEERFDVVPCDPTQATAIAEARRGQSYIIQGPPGTGKSQTITNLIADFVARGQRVLFVCEKRAAIDVVYARLKQAGLGSLCALIHDSQTDKKEFVMDLKQTYEGLLEPAAKSKGRDAPPERKKVLPKLQTSLATLEQFDEAMEAPHANAGIPPRKLLHRSLELFASRPQLSPEQLEGLPRYAAWWEYRDGLASLESSLRELCDDGVLGRHPLRFLAPALAESQRPMELVSTHAERALELFESLIATLGRCGVPADQWDSLARIRRLVDYASRVETLVSTGNLELVEAGSKRAKDLAARMSRIRQADAAWTQAKSLTTAWRSKLSRSDLTNALSQARAWNGKLLAWLSPAWWRLRGVLNRSYDFRSHAVRPTWVQVLTALQEEYDAQERLEQAQESVAADFQLAEPAYETEARIAALREQLAASPDWLRAIHKALLKSPKAAEIVQRIVAAADGLTSLESETAAIMVDYHDLPLSALRQALVDIGQSVRQVPQAMTILGELSRLAPEIGRTLRTRPWSLAEAEAAIAHATWDEVCRKDRSIGRFSRRQRDECVAELETLYDNCLAANAREIQERVRERFLAHVGLCNQPGGQPSAEQARFKQSYSQGRRTLEHEFGKSMRYKAIRELVDGDPGLVVRDLKPVWLMSPLSVSDTLPLCSDLVDVVIFDEASQVPLEEAVPSLFRGKQAIVVGDEMQLPPTSFFAVKTSDEEDEELVATEGDEIVRFDLASDSFLNHAAKNLPSTMLGWHYRSRSETLISFSNWAFYDGRLLTVPDERLPVPSRGESPSELLLSRPLSFHFLTGAVYDQRRNRAEAEYIARLVAELLRSGQGMSIGVIAFSEAQQDEIVAALARLAETDDEFRRLYEAELEREEADGQFVGLLIKNLENIQGDERDLVILSICYGPGPGGKMLMNFGPINQSGGEKRLNVAFSRAKHHMAVVSSIRHQQITNDYNQGAACLKNYLRYAEAVSSGDVAAGNRVLAGISRWRESDKDDDARPDPLAQQLAVALEREGYVVDTGIGQSHFRVDLAVRKPDDTCYRLGILLDTLAHYEHSDPLERDMLRPRLLRNFGWRVANVLGKDWYEDPERELRRLMELLTGIG